MSRNVRKLRVIRIEDVFYQVEMSVSTVATSVIVSAP